jgi:hypothetical protein
MRPSHVTQNDFLFLSVSIFVIIAAWIGFNIYHAWVTTTITEDLQLQIVPIEGRFDTAVIDNLKKRKIVQPLFAGGSLVATPTADLSPTPSPTPLADESLILISTTPTPALIITGTPTPAVTDILEEDVIPTEIPTPTP